MKKRSELSFLLWLIYSAGAYASIVTIPLDCTGSYAGGESWSTELNLYQQFTSINTLSIQWSGSVSSALYCELGGPPIPAFSLPGAFIANLSKQNPYSGIAQAISDQSLWPLPPFDPIETPMPPLEPFSGTDSFTIFTGKAHYLLEGPVTLDIHPDGIGIYPAIYAPCFPSVGEIDSAFLLIDGIPIPEPATAALLTLGALLIRKQKRNS